MENSSLPRELVIDILSRLPVKSLMRFKCVCKFFYKLIKRDQHFMNKHYEKSLSKNDCAVIEYSCFYPSEVYSLLLKEPGCDEVECVCLEMPNSKVRYVKCCHGMFCVILGRGDWVIHEDHWSFGPDSFLDVLIWNPSTRDMKALPSIKMPSKPQPSRLYMSAGFGFGHSSDNMTWKIVMICYLVDPNEQITDTHQTAMVCSRVGDLWIWRQVSVVPHVYASSTEDFYLKGRYYWRVIKEPDHFPALELSNHEQLLWFDMDDEVFGTIDLPSNVESFVVTVMMDTIALISHPFGENETYIEIWLMNEMDNNVEWHKQARVVCGVSIDSHEYWRPRGGHWGEYWGPVGTWNLDRHLLVFPTDHSSRWYMEDDAEYMPFLVSVDLATQERKIIYIKHTRVINIVMDSGRYVQFYKDIQQWKEYFVFPVGTTYARVYSESLKLL